MLTARICAQTLEFSTPLLQVGIDRFLVREVIGNGAIRLFQNRRRHPRAFLVYVMDSEGSADV